MMINKLLIKLKFNMYLGIKIIITLLKKLFSNNNYKFLMKHKDCKIILMRKI